MRFDSKASDYAEKALIQRQTAGWCSEWLPTSGSGLTAIEFGAGSGLLTEMISPLGFDSFVASDISPKMVEAGRVRLPHVEWKTEDAWQPNSRGVDWIFSSSLLQWAVDPVDVLSRWRQQLRPGGRLLSSMYVEGSLAEWEDLMPGFSSLPFLSEEDWRRAFREARFRIEREETTIHILMYPSAKDALKSIHAVGAVEGRRLSPSTLRRLLAEADTRYPNEFPMTWRALRIECSV